MNFGNMMPGQGMGNNMGGGNLQNILSILNHLNSGGQWPGRQAGQQMGGIAPMSGMGNGLNNAIANPPPANSMLSQLNAMGGKVPQSFGGLPGGQQMAPQPQMFGGNRPMLPQFTQGNIANNVFRS